MAKCSYIGGGFSIREYSMGWIVGWEWYSQVIIRGKSAHFFKKLWTWLKGVFSKKDWSLKGEGKTVKDLCMFEHK